MDGCDSVGLGVFDDKPLREYIPFLWDLESRIRVQILPLPSSQMITWDECA